MYEGVRNSWNRRSWNKDIQYPNMGQPYLFFSFWFFHFSFALFLWPIIWSLRMTVHQDDKNILDCSTITCKTLPRCCIFSWKKGRKRFLFQSNNQNVLCANLSLQKVSSHCLNWRCPWEKFSWKQEILGQHVQSMSMYEQSMNTESYQSFIKAM